MSREPKLWVDNGNAPFDSGVIDVMGYPYCGNALVGDVVLSNTPLASARTGIWRIAAVNGRTATVVKCLETGGSVVHRVATNVSINDAGVDVATFNCLPAKWRLRRVLITDASTTLAASSASLGLFSAPGATGTTLVATALLTTLTAPEQVNNLGFSWANTYGNGNVWRTLGAIYVNNVAAHGVAATVTVMIELDDLTAWL